MVDTVQHKSLPAGSLHEDKLIASATTADAGKVTTPSSSTKGVGVLRNLTLADLDTSEVTTADHGKVLTPSGTTNGAVEWSKPAWDDLTHDVATTDAGKVWTPSSATNGAMTLRKLKHSDLDESESVEFSAVRTTNDTYAITAAVDGTLNTASDFVPWPFGLVVEKADNCSYYDVSKTLTIGPNAPANSNYLLVTNITMTASTTSVKAAMSYKINGVLVPNRFVVRGNAAGEFMVGSRIRMVNLHPGDTLQLCVACDKSCTLTLQDFSCALIIN